MNLKEHIDNIPIIQRRLRNERCVTPGKYVVI